MAGKFLEMKEAAERLGITPDEIQEMRSAGEIHGYRDGKSWKFKLEEVERVFEERQAQLSGDEGGESALAHATDEPTVDDEMGDLISLADLDDETPSEKKPASSKSIKDAGDGDELSPEPEDELGLAAEDVAPPEKPEKPAAEAPRGEAESWDEEDFELAAEEELTLGGSDTSLADTGDKSDAELPADEESDVLVGGDDEESDVVVGGDDEESDVLVGGDESAGGGSKAERGSDVSLDEDDELDLGGEEEDEDLVLGGSDVSLAGASGINLSTPGDSGIDLEEEPVELAGSSVSSLELPEDEDIDDILGLDDDEPGDPDEATQLKADEEFMLSPSGELDEDEDSGSQVIALDESEEFGEDADAMFQPTEAALLEEEEDEGAEAFGDAPAAAVGARHAAAQAPEAPYSVWNVVGLAVVALFLLFSGMLITDLARHGASPASTAIMDGIISALGL